MKKITCGIKVKEIMELILKEIPTHQLCDAVPLGVFENAVFVINMNSISASDLSADQTGIYGRHCCPRDFVKVDHSDPSKKISCKILPCKLTKLSSAEVAELKASDDIYLINRQYSYHSTLPMTRTIIRVEHKGAILPRAIIQYRIDGEIPTEGVSLPPHGNSRGRKEPFIRSQPSILEQIRERGRENTPKQIVDKVADSSGGIFVANARDMPRNNMQVHNALRNVSGRKRSRDTGPQKIADTGQLMTMMKCGDFLRDVSFKRKKNKASDAEKVFLRTFAARNIHLSWIKRFCTVKNAKSRLHVDMTYKRGSYYTTVMSMPNPLFVYKDHPERNVSSIVCMSTSVSRDADDYKYMATNLQSFGVKSLIYVTDRELALEKGFEEVFPVSSDNIHLNCFLHMEDDAKRELQKTDITEEKQKEIIRTIFGTEFNGKRVNGIVDCESGSDVDEQFKQYESHWPESFVSWLNTTEMRVRSVKDAIKVCMLKQVRTAAGLGCPPNRITNNIAESMNNVLGEGVERRKLEQAELHEVVEERIIDQQLKEMTRAIQGLGEYRLADNIKHLACTPNEWSKMTPEQRRALNSKVLKCDVQPDEDAETDCDLPELSISIAEIPRTELPTYIWRDIWQKARIILKKYAILPLENGKHCVTEFDKAFNVTYSSKEAKCSCKQFQQTFGLCPHIVSVAETEKSLVAFITKYVSVRDKASKAIAADVPAKAGMKPGSKKRKGRQNIPKKPITEEIPVADFSQPPPPSKRQFTEYWHNNEAFIIDFARQHKRALCCEYCKIEFPRNKKLVSIPYDIIVYHKERYWYPEIQSNGTTEMKLTARKLGKKFYCIKRQCMEERFPYFWKGLLIISADVRSRLAASHFQLLKDQLDWCESIE